MSSGLIPLRDDPDAVARVLWQLTYEEYRQAAQSYLNVKTAAAVRTQEEDTSADFAEAKPEVHLDYAMPAFHLDRKDWEDKVRRYSSYFRKYPEIYSSAVMVIGQKSAGALCLHRRRSGGHAGDDHPADDRGRDPGRRRNGIAAGGNVSGRNARRSAGRSGNCRQDCEDGFRPEGTAGSAHGRAVRRAGVAFWKSSRGFLS